MKRDAILPMMLPLSGFFSKGLKMPIVWQHCYKILLKLKNDTTKELKSHPTKLLLIIFFLPYEYVAGRNTYCALNGKQLQHSINR